MSTLDEVLYPGYTFHAAAVDNELDSRELKVLKEFNFAEEAVNAGITLGADDTLMGSDLNTLMDYLFENGFIESADSIN